MYKRQVLNALDTAKDDADLAEIRTELAESGFIRRQPQKKGQSKPKKAKPMRYISSDGYEILVGKSNLQNDELTLRTAEPTDIWMHTKEIPGSHVIIRTNGKGEVPIPTLEEAANLAAFYSKAKNGSMVPVDYTPVSYTHLFTSHRGWEYTTLRYSAVPFSGSLISAFPLPMARRTPLTKPLRD